MTDYLGPAVAIADALCREALWWRSRCTWLGDDLLPDEDGTVVHGTIGGSVYSGTAGVALFLARVAAVTGDRVHERTAKAAALQAIEQSAQVEDRLKGLFCGRSGVAYAAVVVGRCLGDAGLQTSGLDLLHAVAREDTSTWPDTDVMYGRAGAIVAALRVSEVCSDPGLLEWASRLGSELVERADRNEQMGWSWPEISGVPGMNGFSHGASGIAWALGELAGASGEKELLHAAREATRYEQHWFDPALGNWQDLFPEYLADPARPLSYSVSWCHGAPGIALSRVRLWELWSEQAHEEQARRALGTTLADLRSPVRSRTRNFSLCHGVAGNAEVLVCASVALADDSLLLAARHAGTQGVERYAGSEEGWPCGVDGSGAWSPSLMLGWAGTGYYYLRLDDPEVTPSVLLLDV